MAPFVVSYDTALSAVQAWARVTRWERHGDVVPLTTITVDTPPPTDVGTRFTAWTGVGRVGFDDPMEVVAWDPPSAKRPTGRCRLEKRGRVMVGWAELSVAPTESGCRVTWCEDAKPARLPAFTDPVSRLSGRLLFGRALRGLLT